MSRVSTFRRGVPYATPPPIIMLKRGFICMGPSIYRVASPIYYNTLQAFVSAKMLFLFFYHKMFFFQLQLSSNLFLEIILFRWENWQYRPICFWDKFLKGTIINRTCDSIKEVSLERPSWLYGPVSAEIWFL